VFNWFRKGPPPHQTALAMIGARAGDHVLVVGGTQADLVAELGRVTGLNGEVIIAAPAETHAAFASAAARAGSLLVLEAWDGGPLPAGERPFDVCVWLEPFEVDDASTRRDRATALTGVLRPGGRLVLASDGRTPRGRTPPADDTLLSLLTDAGNVAARHLATDGRTAWYEARRPR